MVSPMEYKRHKNKNFWPQLGPQHVEQTLAQRSYSRNINKLLKEKKFIVHEIMLPLMEGALLRAVALLTRGPSYIQPQ